MFLCPDLTKYATVLLALSKLSVTTLSHFKFSATLSNITIGVPLSSTSLK